jgi:thymidylate synthase ThyX
MTIVAEKITDSIGSHSPRLLTIRATNPKFIHQETLRHRTIYILDALRGDPDFSFSVSSARAIPFPKLLEEVRSYDLRARPVKWGTEQRGMSPGDELPDYPLTFKSSEGGYLSPRQEAEICWTRAAMNAAHEAEKMAALGVHKSIVNRIIEPYIHVHCLMTGVEAGWMNFFGLRLDKAADPTLQVLAEECWKVWNESVPQKLEPGQWHLPYVGEDNDIELVKDVLQDRIYKTLKAFENSKITRDEQVDKIVDTIEKLDPLEIVKRMSAARCARLSYRSFETGKRSTIEEDLNLFNRLVGGPVLHASPCEHQATPDTREPFDSGRPMTNPPLGLWSHPQLHGNLKGWVQFRKTLPGEAVAPLPEGYVRNV